MASAKMANMNAGRPAKDIPPNGGIMTTEQAAALMNVKVQWLLRGWRR